MKKINCNIIRDILPLYLDDVVSDETKQMVEEHLQSCASCRAEASAMKKDVILPASKTQRLAEAKVIKGIRTKIFRKKVIVSAVTVAAVPMRGRSKGAPPSGRNSPENLPPFTRRMNLSPSKTCANCCAFTAQPSAR